MIQARRPRPALAASDRMITTSLRVSHPDEQVVIGFTERALLATRDPFGAPLERDGSLIGEIGA